MEAVEPGILFTVTLFLLLLSILVFVHEWGHYIVARMFKTRVEVFSIGFGKEIFGWTDKSKTRWKISMVPLGGYVKFFGDANAISNPEKALAKMSPEDRDSCFHFKPIWQRMLIVAAGPVINFLFAILLFAGLFTINGQLVDEPLIGNVSEDGAAYQAGLQSGDRIFSYQGQEITTFQELRELVITSPGEELDFQVLRNGEEFSLTVVPAPTEIKDATGAVVIEGRLGIEGKIQHNVFSAVVRGTTFTYDVTLHFFEFFGRMFRGDVSLDEMGGPVKIAQITGQAGSQGVPSYIYIMALISINLGFINLLPIPLLDGGHLLFYSIEAIKGKPISVRAQELASMLGLAFVLGLLFVLTWNDLNLPGLS